MHHYWELLVGPYIRDIVGKPQASDNNGILSLCLALCHIRYHSAAGINGVPRKEADGQAPPFLDSVDGISTKTTVKIAAEKRVAL